MNWEAPWGFKVDCVRMLSDWMEHDGKVRALSKANPRTNEAARQVAGCGCDTLECWAACAPLRAIAGLRTSCFTDQACAIPKWSTPRQDFVG